MALSLIDSGKQANDRWYTDGYGYGTVTLLRPSLAADGDLIVAVLIDQPATTPPSGWSPIARVDPGPQSSARLYANAYQHVVAAGETSWNVGPARGVAWALLRGPASSPIAGYSAALAQAVYPIVDTLSPVGLVMPAAGVLLGFAWALPAAPGSYAWATPAGMTELQDGRLATNSLVWAQVTSEAVGSGATGSRQFTISPTQNGSGWGWAALLVGVLPVAPPTVTSVSPPSGGIDGGTPVTITGTGFSSDCTVDIGGAAATSVVVVSSTQITCVTPARTAGAKTVTVTNAGGDGTLASGFTYNTVVDANVKLVRGGSFVGNDKADTSTQWAGSPSEVEYGGASDLWGTTFTPAQVNASDFGVGIAATVGGTAEARVSYIEMEVAYSVPNVEDPQTYLAVLKVDSDLETAYPAIYRLPRFGFTIANDPSLYKRTSGAELWSSRIYEPARYIEKVWRVFEFGIDITPEASNTVGFQVWAKVEDGSSFQLRDGSGNALTVRASGEYKAFFPASDVARGKYLQLGLVVPDIVGEQVPVEVNLRNMALRFSWRPDRTDAQSMPLDLGEVPSVVRGARNERRSPYQKLVRLMELAGPGKPPVAMRDTLGRDVYAHILGVEYEEVSYKTGVEPHLLAVVSYRVVEYS